MKNSEAKKYLKWYRELLSYANDEMEYSRQLLLTEGVLPEEREKLLEKFPDTPKGLLEILNEIDGTYFRTYTKGQVVIDFFASDVMPHYLNSASQMIEGVHNGESITSIYGSDFLKKENIVGPGIDPDAPFTKRLHFSDCTNNGGTASLYVDFAPGEGGTYGQIIRYVHDPDEYIVVADNFDDFLKRVMSEWRTVISCGIFDCYDLEFCKIAMDGKFNHENAVKKASELVGAEINNRLEEDTDIFILGSHPEKKTLKKAEDLGIDIYPEDVFIEQFLFGFNLDKLS